MKIQDITVKGGTTTYHYKYGDLKWFIRQGRLTGDVGMILIRTETTENDAKVNVYKGFGTIENPTVYIHQLSLIHNPLFDGNMPTMNEILHPKPKNPVLVDYRFELIDLSGYNGQKNIKYINEDGAKF